MYSKFVSSFNIIPGAISPVELFIAFLKTLARSTTKSQARIFCFDHYYKSKDWPLQGKNDPVNPLVLRDPVNPMNDVLEKWKHWDEMARIAKLALKAFKRLARSNASV